MSPIDIVNDLQELVVSTYSGEVTDPLQLYKSKHRISDLCLALLRSNQGPEEYTAILAESCQESSALNLITSLGIADLIAASPNGRLSLAELSSKANADERYLAVALGALVYHGYFTVEKGNGSQVVANNEFSNLLRTDIDTESGKSMKDAVGLSADDGAKATIHLLDAATFQGRENQKTAANIAFGFNSSIFTWMASPGNEWRGKRAGNAMVQLHGMANGGIGEDYPWEEQATPIIDIGGGMGSFEEMLLSVPKNNKLTFTIFDIDQTIYNTKKARQYSPLLLSLCNIGQQVWAAKPQWMQDRVSFVAGDFFESSLADSKIPTRVEGAGTYVIRHVLHDWNDAQVVTILTHVRDAILATPTAPISKLVLVEMMLSETSSRFTHTTSLQLLALNGGITRTEVQFYALIEKAGFIVQSVTEIRGVDLILELKPRVEYLVDQRL